jgi:hypothetical protein
MTRKAAEDQAAANNREHPDRATHRWIAREGAEGWDVARITLPAGFGAQPTGTITEAKPKPPEPDDPRPAYWRNAGGPWVG